MYLIAMTPDDYLENGKRIFDDAKLLLANGSVRTAGSLNLL